MIKLTELEIEKLHVFVKKHYVDFYDVELELVDHLASSIEEKLSNNSEITFEDALEIEFKKFGIMGFSSVVEEKTKHLNRYYRKLVWKAFLEYLKPPKILFLALLVYTFYIVFVAINNKELVVNIIVILLFITPFLLMIFKAKKVKKTKKETNKKWLFDNVIMQLGGIIHFINIGTYTPILFQDNLHWSTTANILFVGSFSIYVMILVISTQIVNPKLAKQFAKQYSDYILK